MQGIVKCFFTLFAFVWLRIAGCQQSYLGVSFKNLCKFFFYWNERNEDSKIFLLAVVCNNLLHIINIFISIKIKFGRKFEALQCYVFAAPARVGATCLVNCASA